MARYIDADLLIEDLKNRMQNTYAGDWIINMIKDQPDIVRCKDCKHYDGSSCGEIAYIMDGYYHGGFELKRPTDFCSYGERIDLDDKD